ncbi:GAF domain-containing protein [Nodosilinea sp. LEGE 07088]|uniref:GAF domain-containing protein n=1 Tax=Nodosilinea sp. LEGE 07088 TaxID=2777968 RepID=UPI001880AB1A|nr:GAF domain-containing protein [Nodosilinea sp. LEGE 07088]MBE9139789.1 GAF domain-containing protein [Nodosilinea sp. LEGE 07088]
MSHSTFAQLQQENDRLITERDRLQSELAQLKQDNDRLRQPRSQSQQASLLGAIAEVANLLLRSPDYTTVLPDVVRLLGEASGSDRCAIIQDVLHPTSQEQAATILSEWCMFGISETIEITSEFVPASPVEHFREIYDPLSQGEIQNFLVANLSNQIAQHIFQEQGNTSMLMVPIMSKGKFWGLIGFDSCGEPRRFDEAEIAILRIAADSIAAAIERQAKDEELRKSEALYRSLFEISNEGIYRWQLDPPVSLNLSIEEQVKQFYQHYSIQQSGQF